MANKFCGEPLLERFTPLPPGTDVDGMARVFAESMLWTAANVTPRAKRSGVLAGWRVSEETKAEKLAAWRKREATREAIARGSKQQHPQEIPENSWETPKAREERYCAEIRRGIRQSV